MSLIINGKFEKALPTTEGDSQRGHWVRGGFVIEYGEEYPRKAAFSLFGADKVAMVSNIPQGMPVQVTFAPESREYNEKWYTENRCISCVPMAQGATQPQYQPPQAQAYQQPTATRPNGGPQAAPVTMPDDPNGDLPF